jgi:hypothetical protein
LQCQPLSDEVDEPNQYTLKSLTFKGSQIAA